MRKLQFVGSIVAALLAVGTSWAALPEPPMQHAAWQAPANEKLPDYVATVAAKLFDAGLADPRGGEYREIDIVRPSSFPNNLTRTHGWLFPENIAVGWDGLVYRVWSVGPAQDLDKDVQLILTEPPPRGGPRPTLSFWDGLRTEKDLAPCAISLLLRLGRADLAARLWTAPNPASPVAQLLRQQAAQSEQQWLQQAANAWLGSAWMRQVRALNEGQDQDAADVGEALVAWRARVVRSSPALTASLDFLTPVPVVTADAQRRLAGPPLPALDLSALAVAPQADRIRQLIAQLENVHVEKLSFPGTLAFAEDPVFKMLNSEGTAAVAALIETYASDIRLTRSFDYSRPWNINYATVPVRDVAAMLLRSILGPAALAGKSPAELLAWWRKQPADREGRAFLALADDRASPVLWEESARSLTEPSGISQNGQSITFAPGVCDPGRPPLAMKGEPYRARSDPSVYSLIARRVVTLVAQNSKLACSIAVSAALWDSKTALPILQEAATLQACRADASVTAARLSLGDTHAAEDWATELPRHGEFYNLTDLAPLWMFPNNSVLDTAAEKLFARSDARLNPTEAFWDNRSVLFAVPAYRRTMLSALDDATVVGTAEHDANGDIAYRLSTARNGAFSAKPDPRQAPPGLQRPIRTKDLVAQDVSQLAGAPPFGLDWTDADRDAAIPAIREFILTAGPKAKAMPMRLDQFVCSATLVDAPKQ